MQPTVICLTPVRNEAWILDRFLRCASLWADHILIADQCSEDGSREIASRYPKVTLIENPTAEVDEASRQRLLIDAARRIPGPRFLMAVDADEFLSANFLDSVTWREMLQSEVGTVVEFQMVNLKPDLQSYWSPPIEFRFGFMDDGTSFHTGPRLHSPRIPSPPNAPVRSAEEVKVLHYQYVNWDRMQSKHRWYQCLERILHSERKPIDVFRQYHHMYAIPENELKPLPSQWIDGYERLGIDMTTVPSTQAIYWWDREVVRWFETHGASRFRREAVWDKDWNATARLVGSNLNGNTFNDPRNGFEKLTHSWLRRSQPHPQRLDHRLVNKALRLLGW